MPTLDIFNDDAFSVTSLTKAINDQPHQPGRIGELGWFAEDGVTTTSFMVERQGTAITLVPTAARGASGQVVSDDKRKLVPIATVHLPQRDAILADEVQGVRKFGSESDVELVSERVNRKLAKLKRNLDVTLEWQRIGALKGQVLDANGTSVLLDMFTTFNVTKTEHTMELDVTTTNVKLATVAAKRKIEAALGGLMYRGLRVLCSPGYFDAFVGHASVEKAYDRWMNGEFLREDQRGGFYFAGAYWEEYRGRVGNQDFIADGDAIMVPEGVPDMCQTNYAPADYMETVNTVGLPYYAKQERMRFDKGVDLEAQSNPICWVGRPDAIAHLHAE